MNKKDFVIAIAKESGLTLSNANKILDAFTKVTIKTLKKGDKITLVGFGTFSVSKRAARKGINPQTGKAIQIKAKKVAKFKSGTIFRKKIADTGTDDTGPMRAAKSAIKIRR